MQQAVTAAPNSNKMKYFNILLNILSPSFAQVLTACINNNSYNRLRHPYYRDNMFDDGMGHHTYSYSSKLSQPHLSAIKCNILVFF